MSFDLLSRLYAHDGSLGMACERLGIKADFVYWQKWPHLVLFKTYLYFNKTSERNIFALKKNLFRQTLMLYKYFRARTGIDDHFWKTRAGAFINWHDRILKTKVQKAPLEIDYFVKLYVDALVINLLIAQQKKQLEMRFSRTDYKKRIVDFHLLHLDLLPPDTPDRVLEVLKDWSFRRGEDMELAAYGPGTVSGIDPLPKTKIQLPPDEAWRRHIRFLSYSQFVRHLAVYALDGFKQKLREWNGQYFQNENDICFLKVHELADLNEAAQKIINDRRQEYDKFRTLNLPEKIESPDPAIAPAKNRDLKEIKTRPLSAGDMSGEVVRGERSVYGKRNKILFVRNLTPETVIKHRSGGGIITYNASLLSHAVILAREFGLPVIGVKSNAPIIVGRKYTYKNNTLHSA